MNEMLRLIDNSEYRIDYFIDYNIDVYNAELCEKIMIIFDTDRRKCLIRNKNGKYVPNPHFKTYENILIPFNLCYLMYTENTGSTLVDSDFDIGFNWADINFEEKIVKLIEESGYNCYYIIDNKISLEKAEYSLESFNGFVFSANPLCVNEYSDLDLDCSDLNGIMSIISSNAVMYVKARYYANYNYIMYFSDEFDILSFLSEMKKILT